MPPVYFIIFMIIILIDIDVSEAFFFTVIFTIYFQGWTRHVLLMKTQNRNKE